MNDQMLDIPASLVREGDTIIFKDFMYDSGFSSPLHNSTTAMRREVTSIDSWDGGSVIAIWHTLIHEFPYPNLLMELRADDLITAEISDSERLIRPLAL